MKNTYNVLKRRKIVEIKYNLFTVMAEVTVMSSYRRWQWPFEKTVDCKTLWLPLNEFGNVVFIFGLSIDRPYPVKFNSIDNALKWLSGMVVVYPRDAYVVDDIDSLKCD